MISRKIDGGVGVRGILQKDSHIDFVYKATLD